MMSRRHGFGARSSLLLSSRATCVALVAGLSSACTKLESASDIIRADEGPAEPWDAGRFDDFLREDAGLDKNADDNMTSEDKGSLNASDAQVEVGSDSGMMSCTDDEGFGGLGCYRCKPTDIITLENACANVTCSPFDNTRRLPRLEADGRLPELPKTTPPGSSTTTPSTVTPAGKACSDLATQGTVVYVTGSSAAKPFLQQIAQQLATKQIYLVYTAVGSCAGVDAIINRTPMTTGALPAPAPTATFWESSASTGKACDLPAQGVKADLGISDVFAQTCPGFDLTNLDALSIRDAHGPIQTMTFAVPAASVHYEISAQAAYLVFGFGKEGGVMAPNGMTPIWDDENYLFQRSASSGTQAMLAAAIGVSAPQWKGKKHAGSDDVAASLQAAVASQETANKAIGILAADYIDTRNLRAQIRVLAYQDSQQKCAVYPDSTANARDKSNVRDGHYPIWGPLHMLYEVDATGAPVNASTRAAVTDIVGYMAGTKPLPNGVKLIDVYAQSGLVPECAMRVSRTKDGGNILPSYPENPCSCLFEAKATGATTCKPCVVQGECAASEICSQGYCEKGPTE